ncbi:MAG: hypothetical protein AAF805_03860 [Planctomycetota bacterium]
MQNAPAARFSFARTFVCSIVLLGAAAPAVGDGGGAGSDDGGAEAPKPDSASFGRFLLRDLRTVEGAKTRLSFSLHGMATGDDFTRLKTMLPHYEHRIRSEVATAVRLTPLPDFQQPGLERFRRRMLVRLRRALPALPIDALLIGEFELFLD